MEEDKRKYVELDKEYVRYIESRLDKSLDKLDGSIERLESLGVKHIIFVAVFGITWLSAFVYKVGDLSIVVPDIYFYLFSLGSFVFMYLSILCNFAFQIDAYRSCRKEYVENWNKFVDGEISIDEYRGNRCWERDEGLQNKIDISVRCIGFSMIAGVLCIFATVAYTLYSKIPS